MADSDVDRRLTTVEAKLEIAYDSITRHLASCERLGQTAAESRNRVENAITALTTKIDGLMKTQDQQLGAIRAGKALYAALGVLIATGAWVFTHVTLVR